MVLKADWGARKDYINERQLWWVFWVQVLKSPLSVCFCHCQRYMFWLIRWWGRYTAVSGSLANLELTCKADCTGECYLNPTTLTSAFPRSPGVPFCSVKCPLLSWRSSLWTPLPRGMHTRRIPPFFPTYTTCTSAPHCPHTKPHQHIKLRPILPYLA